MSDKVEKRVERLEETDIVDPGEYELERASLVRYMGATFSLIEAL